jgi:hypothetical protein
VALPKKLCGCGRPHLAYQTTTWTRYDKQDWLKDCLIKELKRVIRELDPRHGSSVNVMAVIEANTARDPFKDTVED